MQERIIPRCIHGHLAQMICIQDICKQPALICQSKSIDCQGKHAQCVMVISIHSAISKLLSDGRIVDAKDAQILEALDKVIQVALQQKQKYIKLMQNQELRFEGNQRKLFKLFKNGPSSQIIPSFAMTALKKLIKPIDQRVKDEKTRIKKEINKYVDLIKKNIQYIGKLGRKQDEPTQKQQKQQQILDQVVKTPTKQPKFLFTSNLCLYPDFRVQNNGKSIVSLEKGDCYIKFAIITPSPQQQKDLIKKIRLRFIKINGQVGIGMCYKQTIIKNKYRIVGYNNGAYLCQNNYSVLNSTEKNNFFMFQQNDILQMQFQPESSKLCVKNLSKNTYNQCNFMLKNIQQNPLHFCIITKLDKNEIEILDLIEQ